MGKRKTKWQRAPVVCKTTAPSLFGKSLSARTVVTVSCDDPKAMRHRLYCHLPHGHEGEHTSGLTCESIRCKVGLLARTLKEGVPA